MLRTLISDLKAAGHIVITSLDPRIMNYNPLLGADEIAPISSLRKLEKILGDFSRLVDAVYIIAPESNGVLRRLVEKVGEAGSLALNCTPESIRIASNKITFHETMRRFGLPAPETMVLDIRERVEAVKRATSELGFPLVFKPAEGTGCSGLSVVRKKNQISMAVDKMRRETSSKHIIAQRLIKGIAASVSLLSTSEDTLPLTLNKQRVTLASPRSSSSYHGGTLPLNHRVKEQALGAARNIVHSLGGLRGYVGVDMVLTHEGPVIIEVNPRLTTSYIGLRNVVNFNPAQAIIHSVLERNLPKNVRVSGYATFSKIIVPAPTYETLRMTYELDGLISPPFPTGNDEAAYGLVAASSAKLSDARTSLHRTERHLLDILWRAR